MMVLSDAARDDLTLVQAASDDALRALCNAALRCLREPEQSRDELLTTVAATLKVPLEPTVRMVDALAFVFSEAAKLSCSESDLRDSLVSFAFRPSALELIAAMHLQVASELRERARRVTARPPHYTDLEWRLDVELASRSLHRQANPTWLLKLHTNDANGQPKTELLQTDAVNLKHLLEELMLASSEQNAGYAKRVMRNIK